MSLKARVETVTPTKAKRWLKLNTMNRNVRKKVVKRYASDMESGRWTLNGEPFIIADDGTLLDGQHRCEAVVESGKPIQALVVKGVDPKTFTTIDSCVARTASDVMRVQGETHCAQLASACRLLAKYRNGGLLNSRSSPSTAEKLALLDNEPGLRDAVHYVNCRTKLISRSFLGFFLYVAREASPEKADAFVDGLIDGDNLSKTSPIHLLRERLIENASAIEGRKIKGRPLWYLVFRAWRAFKSGRRITKIQLPRGGQFVSDQFVA